MTDKPRPGDPAANPSDIKPSLARRIVRVVLITAGSIAGTVITVTTGIWVTQAWESWRAEKKTLLLTTISSQNLATTPEGLASPLEFRLVLSPTNKLIIKSIFGYQVAVHNQSREAVENLALHLYPPPNVKLIDPPIITSTDSKILADFVLQSKRVLEKEIVFDLDLLGAGQRVTLAYSGYSEEAIVDPSYIDVETRKKGWEIRKVIPGYSSTYNTATGQVAVSHGAGYSDYDPSFEPYERGPSSVLSKQIAAYNGGDVIALFLLLAIMASVSGLLTWLLARVLSDSSKLFQDWRSLVERLFHRAG